MLNYFTSGFFAAAFRGLIRRPGEKSATADVYDLISAIDKKVRGQESIEEIVACLDAARLPLSGYFGRHLESSVAAKVLTLKVLNLLLAKHHLLTRSTVVLSRPY